MKTKFYSALLAVLFISNYLHAQNTFPSTGRAGIYTTSPAASLQVKGGVRFGTLSNYVNIDSATGNLSFAGTSGYLVSDNKYAFQYAGNLNYGLFFNSSATQYEFRNGSAAPIFSINANSGNSVVNGSLKIGAYTLPATDGSSGQVLTTNGSGTAGWSTVSSSGGSQWTTTGSNIYYSTGNVGIGTTAPAALLDVNGDAHINGVTVGLGSGTNNAGNLAYGSKALYSNVSGTSNTAIGTAALYTSTTGSENNATGFDALLNTTTGSNNTANGMEALLENTTGSYNTAIGNYALDYNTTGTFNTALGYGANVANGSNLSNATAVGAYATVAQSNSLVLGGTGSYAVKVGIGTTTPGSTLDVTGGSWDLSSNEGDFRIGSPTYRMKIGVSTSGGGAGDVRIRSAGGTGRLMLGSNSLDALTINNTGQVGIGTTTPGANLDMLGGSWDLSSNEGDFRIGNPTYRMKIGVATDGGGAGDVRIRAAGGTARLLLGSNTTDVLTINSAGKVGIGTTNPQYPLSVNGTIQAKEVRVETGWSDFVFDKNYKLRTLGEVEKYIDQNHHLPQIPSAADIQKNGLAVADVQTRMMQKIEELTLYIIQMQKQIDQLKLNNHENK